MRRLPAILPILLLLGAVGLAGCTIGGSSSQGEASDTQTPEGPGQGFRGGFDSAQLTEEQQQAIEAFRGCLQEQGVEPPQRPPPDGGGGGPSQEQLDAFESCAENLPDGLGGPGGFGPGPGGGGFGPGAGAGD